MSVSSPFEIHIISVTIRFIQGYRYLDRCGEAMLELEDTLATGWIPAELSPKSGNLKNDQLGMTATFNSESMTVAQSEYISFEHFLEQACLVYETLWQTFDIKRINLPSLRVIAQKGFEGKGDGDGLEEASKYLMGLSLCTPHRELGRLLGGQTKAVEFVMVTEDDQEWNETLVHRRRRLQGQVIRQERQQPFDERMLKRARHLPERQKDAIAALMRLRKQHPETASVAAQLDMEDSFETEFGAKEFDLPNFLQQGWQWANTVREAIPQLRQDKA